LLAKEELIKFVNIFISVGVQNYDMPSQLFFYYGVLRYVDDEIIKLETQNGYKIIRLVDIMDIHKTRERI
jgi:hypothetical protein